MEYRHENKRRTERPERGSRNPEQKAETIAEAPHNDLAMAEYTNIEEYNEEVISAAYEEICCLIKYIVIE